MLSSLSFFLGSYTHNYSLLPHLEAFLEEPILWQCCSIVWNILLALLQQPKMHPFPPSLFSCQQKEATESQTIIGRKFHQKDVLASEIASQIRVSSCSSSNSQLPDKKAYLLFSPQTLYNSKVKLQNRSFFTGNEFWVDYFFFLKNHDEYSLEFCLLHLYSFQCRKTSCHFCSNTHIQRFITTWSISSTSFLMLF